MVSLKRSYSFKILRIHYKLINQTLLHSSPALLTSVICVSLHTSSAGHMYGNHLQYAVPFEDFARGVPP